MNDGIGMRCPRCKAMVEATDEEALADTMLEHLQAHGHEPPRDHVLGRIRRHAGGA